MENYEKDFLEANIINYHTISQAGFVRNIDLHILNEYERLFRKYLNSSYIMCKYCKDDVFFALEKLYEYYLALPQEQVQNIVPNNVQEDQIIKPKRGRPRK